jgi:hypothetical protein
MDWGEGIHFVINLVDLVLDVVDSLLEVPRQDAVPILFSGLELFLKIRKLTEETCPLEIKLPALLRRRILMTGRCCEHWRVRTMWHRRCI